MAITKAFATVARTSSSGTTWTTDAFDSTGYTHLAVFTKHEGGTTTITPSDNKSSAGWTSHTKQGNGAADSWAQFHSVLIGTPGSGHTVTMTNGASVPYRTIIVWLMDADSGDISLVDEDFATATGTAIDAGTLSNAGADSVVSFMGVAEYASETYTPGTGWTEDADPSGGSETFSYGQSRGPETTTSIDPACTGSSSQDWAACAVMFKDGAGGGGGGGGEVVNFLGRPRTYRPRPFGPGRYR